MADAKRRTVIVITAMLCAGLCLSASASAAVAPSPPLPDPIPAAAAAAGAPSREAQLEDEVAQLKAMVRDLRAASSSYRCAVDRDAPVPPPDADSPMSSVAAYSNAGTGGRGPTPSGLAGPGGFKRVPGVGDSGLEEPPTSQSRAVSGGTREFPNSQLEGNRAGADPPQDLPGLRPRRRRIRNRGRRVHAPVPHPLAG